jgi:hypothetical protein
VHLAFQVRRQSSSDVPSVKQEGAIYSVINDAQRARRRFRERFATQGGLTKSE